MLKNSSIRLNKCHRQQHATVTIVLALATFGSVTQIESFLFYVNDPLKMKKYFQSLIRLLGVLVFHQKRFKIYKSGHHLSSRSKSLFEMMMLKGQNFLKEIKIVDWSLGFKIIDVDSLKLLDRRLAVLY